MAEQLPIEGHAWEEFPEQAYFDETTEVFPWIGVEDYEDIDWSEYTDEQLDEFCSFLQQRKGFLNGVHQGVIDERVKRVKEEKAQPVVQEGEQQFRPDVRLRMAQQRERYLRGL